MGWPPGARVLFFVAAGPRLGFGHVTRSRSLARALGVPLEVAVRGTDATRQAVRDLGASVVPASAASMARMRPALIVVDDPCQAAAAESVAQARRFGVPVASVHDLGLSLVNADLIIDGTIAPDPAAAHLAGPAFAILDPRLRERCLTPAVRTPDRVLIALGGGAHVLRFGRAFASALWHAVPGVDICVVSGFAGGHRADLPAGAQWIRVRRGLAAELARCSVAVLAGGMTLYEACALGTPAVAVSVAPAQRRTIRAMADRGTAIDGGVAAADGTPARVAAAVRRLLRHPEAAREIGARGRQLVDGQGAFRVAAHLTRLVRRAGGQRHAA